MRLNLFVRDDEDWVQKLFSETHTVPGRQGNVSGQFTVQNSIQQRITDSPGNYHFTTHSYWDVRQDQQIMPPPGIRPTLTVAAYSLTYGEGPRNAPAVLGFSLSSVPQHLGCPTSNHLPWILKDHVSTLPISVAVSCGLPTWYSGWPWSSLAPRFVGQHQITPGPLQPFQGPHHENKSVF